MGRLLFKGYLKDGQYALPLQSARSSGSANVSALSVVKVPVSTWHSRLGHANKVVVDRIISTCHIFHNQDSKDFVCDACVQAKMHKLPLYSTDSVSTKAFQIIFSDVWTSPIRSPFGYKYFVSFIDDYSRFVWLVPLKLKSKVYQAFLEFNQLVKRHFQSDIQALHFDWGGEYRQLHQKFKEMGIHYRISAPYTPE